MELIRRLATLAFSRPNVLVVATPIATPARLAVERWSREHGWASAGSPADADLLVVCGTPVSVLADAASAAFAAMPFPRHRIELAADATMEQVGEALLAGRDSLLDLRGQRTAAHEAASQVLRDAGPDEPNAHRGAMDHGAMDHSMHMGMVDGLPMASRAEDRDGLKLDVLHVPVGPILPSWPAGLALRLAIQGDVVQQVQLGGVAGGAASRSYWNAPAVAALRGTPTSLAELELRRAASHLDSLSRLLDLAGATAEAMRCLALRDGVLAGQPDAAAVSGLARRLRRSRVLRAMTDGLGVLASDKAVAAGVTGPALRAAGIAQDFRIGHPAYPGFTTVEAGGGDVTGRMRQWIAEAEQALNIAPQSSNSIDDGEGIEGPRGVLRAPDSAGPSEALLRVLPELLEGCELAGARLIVASLDPDLAECAEVTWADGRAPRDGDDAAVGQGHDLHGHGGHHD